ncbi:MAG: helix-turn-helix domain-containing protein [Thermoplasmataceae archaeon]
MIGTIEERLLAKLQSKKYRGAYVAAQTTTGIAYQVRALREQRQWTQENLGRLLGKGQNAVSRIEDPDDGRLTIKNLTELAAAFDVALLVKFVPFTKFFAETADKSPNGLEVVSFSEAL